MKLYSAEQSQQLDKLAIASGNFPGILLMKRAAYRAFQTLRQHWPQAQKIYILCGTGNNGGDGLALAQYAILEGLTVNVALIGDSDHFKPDAQQVFTELTQLGITPCDFSLTKLEEADLVVDALLGIGLNKDIEGKFSDIISQVNQAHKPVLALDIPTGINATTGQVHGCAIRADVTISFITHKLGLYTSLGADHIGKKVIDDLNLPTALFDQIPSLADFHDLAYWQNKMPKRSIAAHKGVSGTSLLIGGNHSMAGAIQLAASAALRAGSGLVKVVSQAGHLQALTEQQPELMTYTAAQLETLLPKASAIGIGPGLGFDDWAQTLFQQTIQQLLHSQIPTVMDADALKLLAQEPTQRPDQPNWVLTPHPGEAAQMLGCSTQAVQSDRLAAVQKLHEIYGGVVVLKGNGSLIFDGERTELCPLGNPGMAVGGMGDVLTGMITGYLAQGMEIMDAACLGVYQHAAIADQVITNRSLTSLIPSDIIAGL